MLLNWIEYKRMYSPVRCFDLHLCLWATPISMQEACASNEGVACFNVILIDLILICASKEGLYWRIACLHICSCAGEVFTMDGRVFRLEPNNSKSWDRPDISEILAVVGEDWQICAEIVKPVRPMVHSTSKNCNSDVEINRGLDGTVTLRLRFCSLWLSSS